MNDVVPPPAEQPVELPRKARIERALYDVAACRSHPVVEHAVESAQDEKVRSDPVWWKRLGELDGAEFRASAFQLPEHIQDAQFVRCVRHDPTPPANASTTTPRTSAAAPLRSRNVRAAYEENSTIAPATRAQAAPLSPYRPTSGGVLAATKTRDVALMKNWEPKRWRAAVPVPRKTDANVTTVAATSQNSTLE